MQKNTFKYSELLVRYILAPLHTQFLAGGAQVGRVDLGGNPCQKVDFQKLLPGARKN